MLQKYNIDQKLSFVVLRKNLEYRTDLNCKWPVDFD